MAGERTPDSVPDGTPFGPFVLERRLAVGGSAEVFLAHHRDDARSPVVIKRLLEPTRERSETSMLEHEAELHQAISHPNVVTVFGAGAVEGEPYLVMEYVRGVDLYRLMRRAEAEQRRMSPALAVHVARRVAIALEAVHTAIDAEGRPLGVVHRDVTPTNVYLSLDGQVKLGDFGIARVTRHTHSGQPTAGLKGKLGYLAPEQVAGLPFDHRADLFSLGVVLAEMLIGGRLFPGGGQLAVLLAIRDGDIGRLESAADQLPPGLYAICQALLATDPQARPASAAELERLLTPFEPEPEALRDELSRWVKWASAAGKRALELEGKIRDSLRKSRAVRLASHGGPPMVEPKLSRVRRAGESASASVSFARLVQMIATGELAGDDQVALMGADFRPIAEIGELARHLLPSTTATTGRMFRPGAPDYHTELGDTPMLSVLARMRIGREGGALFVERRDATGGVRRKEIYLRDGRLWHVASSERAELLGEYLVRRGVLGRSQLDTALTMMHRYGGRLGDTLVGMGLVDAMHVFRAIRDQGRDRVAALCGWERGKVDFYRDTAPTHVEFPLEIDLATAMMAGTFVVTKGDPCSLLPAEQTPVAPGLRHPRASDEAGSVPSSLAAIPKLVEDQHSVGDLLAAIARPSGDRRAISRREACAALVVAHSLGWVAY